jgi:cytochrome c biogenesis protein CcmG/thiol:disulfide interchange protein DsbE
MHMRYLVPLAVFLVLTVFLAIGLTLDPKEVPSPFIGKPAPEFTLPEVSDSTKTLNPRALKGQVFLLNVWASWCVSCRQEHSVLLELAKRNLVPLYGLNYKDERGSALRWLEQLGNPYIASGFDADGRVGIDWGVYGVPETFLIDRAGVVRYKHTGPLTRDVLETKLLPLIRQLQGSPT